jgi:hypothetical protein
MTSRDAQINALRAVTPLNSVESNNESARSRSNSAFEWRSALPQQSCDPLPRNFLTRDQGRLQMTLCIVVGAQIGLEIGAVCLAGRNITVGEAGIRAQ